MNNHVDKSLKKIITYAYQEVDYYRNLFNSNAIDINSINTKDDLSKLPFLTKKIVQKESLQMVANEYKKYPKNQFIQIRRTSGSTGEYLKVYWDNSNDIRSMLYLWRLRNKFYLIEPSMKSCTFHTVDYRRNKIVKAGKEELSFDGKNISFCKVGLTYERLKECYDKILSFNPDWFNLQPSIAYLLAKVVKENNLPIPSNLKYIELSGELLLNEYRETIKEVFNIEPINEYGTNETNVIAIEYDNLMHIIEDNVIVEVIKDGKSVIGEEGEICVTSLTNYAMPFIRYRTGDLGVIKRSDPNILDIIYGRTSDFIYLENGEKLNSYILLGIIQYTNEYMANVIRQFQITQTGLNSFDVLLALKKESKNWASAVKQSFIENISEEHLRHANWNFRFTDNILPDINTGKTKYFKSLDIDKYFKAENKNFITS